MREIIEVPEWIFDKISNSAKSYNILIRGKYEEGPYGTQLSHKYLYVNDIMGESEKAIYVDLDAETIGGKVTSYKVWIPKSVIKEIEK